jgi:hypothetical protein
MCEATQCDWKCSKPSTCSKPKCELVCEKSACEAKDEAESKCCPCNADNVASAVAKANSKDSASDEPSFMEIMHTMKFKRSQGDKECCPCN